MTTADSAAQAAHLMNLGIALSERHIVSGDPRDLDRVVVANEDAVYATAAGSPDLAGRLANLGTGLAELYGFGGDPGNLDRVITILERAVGLEPDNQRNREDLALALRDRYLRDGDLTELDRAVAELEASVDDAAPASRLDQLAVTLRLRAIRRDDGGELRRALLLQERAVAAGDGPHAVLLNNLAGTRRAMFDATGDREYLDRAIVAYRDALDATAETGTERAGVVTNLGSALLDRFDLDQSGLDEAVWLLDAAVKATAPSAPDLPGRLANLANGLRRLADTDDRARRSAVATYRRGCRMALDASCEVGLRAGRTWGSWASRRRAWPEAAEAGELALAAAERLLREQLARRDLESWLAAVQGVPVETSYALARMGAMPAAAATLEWGRARLLAEALERDRADLQRLAADHPEIHERYRAAASRAAVLAGRDHSEGGVTYLTDGSSRPPQSRLVT